ncbi:uncharacterized protein SPAPADRAFT_68248 [Spathaspora passalidarum NRRL Y-27907]|uniref:Uncharacterized protein n=1 Tax=Spathaspora passalidarum (strain NRRL Y-27907 / 11-Y1) TaxID=619300 RepID=G3AS75_SPAPN|nr:uncharacterized protein SPAPADRAFT_68248 [Spathaspora passalidarum NRRL Y-27907]EGW31034.1 hypothetical protein SPAPADRAFT_68248 [Spathaspora passalidarum NRRL Y-27907]
MDNFPDVTPNTVDLIHSGSDFKDVMEILRCKITIEDFKYLLSLDNLKRLLLSRMDLRMIQSELNNNPRFSNHPNLASIEISYLNAKVPENLCRLYLVNAGLESIVVDELPVGLKYLSLAKNEIYTISGKSWPGSLEYLSLADNEFDDDAVKELVETIGWPPILKFLDISGNPIQHLQTLKRLPGDLQTLVAAEVPWKLSKRQVGEFPSNLTGLALHCCYFGNLSHFLFPPSLTSLRLIHNEIKDVLSYSDWSQLKNLYKLDLSSNSIKSLDGWILPPNLLQLRVNCNPIKKLTSKFPLFNRNYNFRLLRFEMRECKIKKVDIDYVPPNLKVFDLSTSKLPKSIVWPTTSNHFQQLLLPKNVECIFRSEKISVIE